MADVYESFQELAANEREGLDWTREYLDRGSRVLIMAPHAGWIEPFTGQVARGVAGDELSLYLFRGLKEEGNETLHLTSHRFDEPLALQAASSARRILAIHGERSSHREFVMVGGRWEAFCRRIGERFREAGIPVEGVRVGLGGVNPENICNRGRSGAGGQLEISEALRRNLRERPREFRRFVTLVREVLLELENEQAPEGFHGR